MDLLQLAATPALPLDESGKYVAGAYIVFLVSLAAMALLWVTLVKFELTAKSARGQVKRLRRAIDAPAAGGASRVAPEVS